MVRHKNRYMVLQVNSNKVLGTYLQTCIVQKVQSLYGDFGVAAIRSGFTAKYCNEITKIAVLRCRKGPHKFISSSIPFIKGINQVTAYINILYVGASMKHCFKFIHNYQEKKFNEYCKNLRTDEEKNDLKKRMLNINPETATL
ncbi:unnamed protein product [Brassicogethes aeneus]|uniref:Ribonuclease P/MRP protein subunit POP5 n=1 Tax=Brassicogethes aeneus TaxID=1431903 RepID=A0A9P0B602_BRAAE|nr:unnamed protein product [Brassicogethes aeneus]